MKNKLRVWVIWTLAAKMLRIGVNAATASLASCSLQQNNRQACSLTAFATT